MSEVIYGKFCMVGLYRIGDNEQRRITKFNRYFFTFIPEYIVNLALCCAI
jgi:hypothetical protein